MKPVNTTIHGKRDLTDVNVKNLKTEGFPGLFRWAQCNQKGSYKRVSIGFANWPLYTESKEKLEKEADHSRLVGGHFNEHRN